MLNEHRHTPARRRSELIWEGMGDDSEVLDAAAPLPDRPGPERAG